MAACRVALVLSAACLASCTLPGPRDLRLKSVEVAHLDLDDFNPGQIRETEPGRNTVEVLKISFHTRTNLFETRRATGFNIGAEAASCNGGQIELPVGYVYWKGYSANAKIDSPPASGEDMVYSVYGPVRLDSAIATRIGKPEFDLQHEPFDVCLRVHGGNMAGMQFWSNVLRVPQQQIFQAFQKQKASTE